MACKYKECAAAAKNSRDFVCKFGENTFVNIGNSENKEKSNMNGFVNIKTGALM